MQYLDNFKQNIRNRNIQLVPDYNLKHRIPQQQWLDWFYAPKGEHYTLLTWASNQFEDQTLYDIGTLRGLSALALSSNQNNTVITYDIEPFPGITYPDNVFRVIGNFFKDYHIFKSPCIMFDVDPHDGIIEREFMQWLDKHYYHGVVLLDDIHLNKEMQSFWDSIALEKHDLSEFGHHSGTGAVIFP